jgi:hypothetical protein
VDADTASHPPPSPAHQPSPSTPDPSAVNGGAGGRPPHRPAGQVLAASPARGDERTRWGTMPSVVSWAPALASRTAGEPPAPAWEAFRTEAESPHLDPAPPPPPPPPPVADDSVTAKLRRGQMIEQFLHESASQLTYYGLAQVAPLLVLRHTTPCVSSSPPFPAFLLQSKPRPA